MNTETIEVVPTEQAVVLAEIIPSAELEKYNATDEALKHLRETAIQLSGKPIETDDEYVEIHKTVMVAVKVRTTTADLAKDLAAPHKETAAKIIAEGKRIGDHAKESENLLRPLKEAYEAEQKRIKEERAKAEAAKLAERTNSLVMLGATFDGMTYDVHGVLIDAIELKLPDDEWLDLYGSAKKAYDTEQTRLAEQQRLIEEKNARIENERKLEQKRQEEEKVRLAAEAKAQAEARQQLEQQKAQFEAEQQKQRDEMAKMLAGMRKAQLTAIGMTEKDGDMVYGDRIWFPEYSLRNADNVAFDRVVAEFNQWLADEKQKAEEAVRLAKLLEDRKTQLWGVGFTDLDGNGAQSWYTRLSNDDIVNIDDQGFEEFIQKFVEADKQRVENQAARDKAQKQAEADRKKADKERQERLKPDKKLIAGYFTKVSTLVGPKLKEVEADEFMNRFYADIDRVVIDYKKQLEAL